MPLIIISGFPSSSKSTWAQRLEYFFSNEKGKDVIVIKEQVCLREDKNVVLDDSRKEKEVRAKVKSEAQRLLTKENVVIIDALNYIKGYRYELYCMSKSIPTRQVTIQTDTPVEKAWEWNVLRPEGEQYKREVFDKLVQRYEHPDPQNRWDSPFFSVLPGESLDMEGIYTSLFLNKPPKQNLSTKNNPVSESGFVHSLDKITSDIVQAIINGQKNSEELEQVPVPHSTATINLDERVTLVQLTKLKRQFMTLSKTSGMKGDSGDLFVQYLNSQLKGS